MSAQPDSAAVSALRAVTYRISATPIKQLPHIIPHLCATLGACRPLLSNPTTSKGKEQNDTGSLVHKFRTQISSLLQDRTPEGRWAAVILVKAAVEHGSTETLKISGPWVRGLLSILSKPDPPTTRRLCVVTLTRIFTLTKEHPGLVREITTPSLPAYVEKCLDVFGARQKSFGSDFQKSATQRALLGTVLGSFNELLPRHPTIFRSYSIQIRHLLSHIVAQTPSNADQTICNVADEAVELGRRLFVQIAFTAPKGEGPEEWLAGVSAVVQECHRTADHVFRSVIEEWDSVSPLLASTADVLQQHEMQDEDSKIGLSAWKGIFAGGERLAGLTRLLQHYVSTSTPASVKFPLDTILDLITRLFSIRIPKAGATNELRPNTQVSKHERDHLWALLPNLHVAALSLAYAIHERFRSQAISFSSILLSHILWSSTPELSIPSLRTELYLVLNQILGISGTALDKETINSPELGLIVRSCCNDILSTRPHKKSDAAVATNGMNGVKSTMIESDPNPSTLALATDYPDLRFAAQELLFVLTAQLPQRYVPPELRKLLERTAILTRHKEALLATALIPDSTGDMPSILPLLSRLYPDSLEFEGLVRPRLPVIRVEKVRKGDDEEDEDEHRDEVEELVENQIYLEEDQAMSNAPPILDDSNLEDSFVASAQFDASAEPRTQADESQMLNMTEIEKRHEPDAQSGATPPFANTKSISIEKNSLGAPTGVIKRSSSPVSFQPMKKPRNEIEELGSIRALPVVTVARLEMDAGNGFKSNAGNDVRDIITVVSQESVDDAGVGEDTDSGSDIEVPMISLEDSDDDD